MEFAREGASVVVNGRDENTVLDAAREIEQLSRPVLAVVADVTDEAQVRHMIDQTIAQFKKIDVLVNNAGGGGGVVSRSLEGTSLENWNNVIGLNLTSTFLCSRAVAEHMKRQRSGRIVNMASQAARGVGELSGVPYAAAKAGILGFTRQIAKELGPFGILVNAVAPAITISGPRIKKKWGQLDDEEKHNILGSIPLGYRLADVREIVNVVKFLSSDDASYITGATIDINGGRYMC